RKMAINALVKQIESGHDTSEAEKQYDLFIQSVWHKALVNGLPLDTQSHLDDNLSIAAHIDAILAKNHWTPLIDKFVQTFGSPTQLQHLRELLNTTLNNSTDNNKPIENKLTYLSLVLADTIKKMNQSDTLSAKNILDYLI